MNFDASLLVVMAIFWVVYAILRWSFFAPVSRLLDEREHTVRTAGERFEAAATRLENGLATQRGRLVEARRELAKRREEIRREAEAAKAAVLDEARRAARADLDRMAAGLDAEVATEKTALAARVDTIANEMVRKLLGRAA